MEICILAHRGEAQTFIKELKAKALSEDLYEFSKGLIYISKEGPYEIMVKLGVMLKEFNIKEIINLGIAGSLSTQLEVGEIYEIRCVYLEDNAKIQFQSYTLNPNASFDCITAHSRVLNNDHRIQLAPIADIVDRELWAIAKVAHNYKVNCKSFKLISDLAGDQTQCFDLKEKAKEYSDKLFEFYLKKEIIHKDYTQKLESPFKGSQYQRSQLTSDD